MATRINSAGVVGKFISPRLLRRACGERGLGTSVRGSRVVTGTAATDRAGDSMLWEQGTWDYAPCSSAAASRSRGSMGGT